MPFRVDLMGSTCIAASMEGRNAPAMPQKEQHLILQSSDALIAQIGLQRLSPLLVVLSAAALRRERSLATTTYLIACYGPYALASTRHACDKPHLYLSMSLSR